MFDVVIAAPGNSSVHVPNLPVITGTFDGTIDLSLAILSQVPLGSITGTFTITQMADASGTLVPVTPVLLPFTGTFRLPFRIDQEGWVERSDDEGEAFYLADDFMTLMEVRDRERRSEEHTSELQSLAYLVCRLLLEKKKDINMRLVRPRTRYDPQP